MKIRAHHGMCLGFFEGKGYDNDFSVHMQKVQDDMEPDTVLEVVAAADGICGHCPNLVLGRCTSADLVEGYDKKVLKMCELKEHSVLTWEEFTDLVKNKILIPGRRHQICGTCEWSSICDRKEKEILEK